MFRKHSFALLVGTLLSSCSLAPDLKMPDLNLPASFKQQPVETEAEAAKEKGNWKKGEKLENTDRGQWWKIFGDEKLNELQKQALEANQSLKAAAARVVESRATAESYTSSYLPNLSIGGNAVRAQQSGASLAAFGQPARSLNPYSLYNAQGTLSYELDLFGRVSDTYKSFNLDADAEEATYRSVLLALQADVAQHYYSILSLDSERQLVRETVRVREEAARIMRLRYDVGEAGEQDLTRTISELASAKADLLALDRQRNSFEHALAVLLGKLPSEFTMADSPLVGVPPAIPAGLPSSLLERRPDIAAAQATMAAQNARIGVARSAFFPSINLTATGGYESTDLSDLFLWSTRSWSLGQLAGNAITMPIFDTGRNLSRLDSAKASYDEALANYRQQVLVAFRDVEDNLSNQRMLGEQSVQQDIAAAAAARTTEVIEKRYKEGDVDFFEVVNAERDSLNAGRAAVQIRGQRFITTVNLIRALGGGWPEPTPEATPAVEPEKPAVEKKADKPAAKKKATAKKSSKKSKKAKPSKSSRSKKPAAVAAPVKIGKFPEE